MGKPCFLSEFKNFSVCEIFPSLYRYIHGINLYYVYAVKIDQLDHKDGVSLYDVRRQQTDYVENNHRIK